VTTSDFQIALENTDEIQLTTTGRVTGQQASRPVWYVQQAGKLYLLPVTGSDSQWYKNVLKTPAVRLAADDVQLSTVATPVTDPGVVARVIAGFRAKYGAGDVAKYYPHPNVAVEIPLG
jgi:deazaflavin-dependent oxidoreductase (nitroreductase family)